MSLRAPILMVTGAWAHATCGAAKKAALDASSVLRSIRAILFSRWKIPIPVYSNSRATRGRASRDLGPIAMGKHLPDLPACAHDLNALSGPGALVAAALHLGKE